MFARDSPFILKNHYRYHRVVRRLFRNANCASTPVSDSRGQLGFDPRPVLPSKARKSTNCKLIWKSRTIVVKSSMLRGDVRTWNSKRAGILATRHHGRGYIAPGCWLQTRTSVFYSTDSVEGCARGSLPIVTLLIRLSCSATDTDR